MLNFSTPASQPSHPTLPGRAGQTPGPAEAGAGPVPAALSSSHAAPSRTPMTQWLAAMLDEIDYPMVLVSSDGQLLHANQVARAEMDSDLHPLQLLGDELRVLHGKDVVPLREALQAAALRGLRRLLTLGSKGQPVAVAVVPMPAAEHLPQRAVLLVLGKRQVCEQLSAQWFAREHHLTRAETQVLDTLCAGLSPQEAAVQLGVAVSTVRSQISNIRAKTGTRSIRALVRQVAVLPPLLGTLRILAPAALTVN